MEDVGKEDRQDHENYPILLSSTHCGRDNLNVRGGGGLKCSEECEIGQCKTKSLVHLFFSGPESKAIKSQR